LGLNLEREIPDLTQGFLLTKFLGEAGFYREIGLSVDVSSQPPRAFLTLGDLNAVTTTHQGRFGLLHTHSKIFVNREKRVMGWQDTLAPEFGDELRSTALAIFSKQDIAYMLLEAPPLAQMGIPLPFLYDLSTRTYRNWVQHPYGLSRVAIELKADGTVKRLQIHYAIYDKEGLDQGHAAEIQKLKLWIQRRYPQVDVQVQKVTVEELEGEVKK
jgi:hypothetical protein